VANPKNQRHTTFEGKFFKTLGVIMMVGGVVGLFLGIDWGVDGYGSHTRQLGAWLMMIGIPLALLGFWIYGEAHE
jgi:hypothetical protein